jgi:glycosyltransferase involved in cell wall biosynthesis
VRVLYDPQTFLRQRAGGISRFFTELIRQFDAHPELGVDPVIRFRRTNNVHAAESLHHRGVTATPAWLPRGVIYAPWWLTGNRGEGQADIVHHTYYDPRFLRGSTRARRAVTVYDMIPELFAGTEHYTASHLAKREFVEAADLIICISESTRQDLIDVYGVPRGTVTVIPLAVQEGFAPGLEPLSELPASYALYVGFRAGYKDFQLLPRALTSLRTQGIDLPLVVVGEPFSANESRLLRELGMESSTVNVRLSDADLRRAYSNAAVTVQTSRYEGFGLIPLEAMASGCPVVAATAAAVREVGSEAISYFSPGEVDDLVEQLRAVITDESRRKTMRSAGLSRAQLFTPLLMAQRTAEAYSSLKT